MRKLLEFNYLKQVIRAGDSLYLNEIRKNPGSRPGRRLAANRTLFAGTPDRRFSLNFVPFMKHPG